MKGIEAGTAAQQARNQELLAASRYLGDSVASQVLPLQVDIGAQPDEQGLGKFHQRRNDQLVTPALMHIE